MLCRVVLNTPYAGKGSERRDPGVTRTVGDAGCGALSSCGMAPQGFLSPLAQFARQSVYLSLVTSSLPLPGLAESFEARAPCDEAVSHIRSQTQPCKLEPGAWSARKL